VTVHITIKEDDPVADIKMNDAYMLWALQATEEVVGTDGVNTLLRQSGLEKYIDNFPPEDLEPPGSGVTNGDYARLNAGILTFYGRAGRGMVRRIGRIAAAKAIEHQSGTFNLATVIAAKLLPSGTQIKMALSAMIAGWRVMGEKFGDEFIGTIEDGGDHWKLIIETDACSAGLTSDQPIGWLIEGAVEEAGQRVFGKFFDVEQEACRSMGAEASIWTVPKKPTKKD
jgi:predicted hydrocarbon binding protein